MMESYFKPYEGKNPYLFVSYSHKNSEAVLATASRLNQEQFRVWYDEGIPAGNDWPDSVEQHLRRCAKVLFFRSADSLASENCFSEISTAHILGIPVVVIALDDTACSKEWSEALEGAESAETETVESSLSPDVRYEEGESVDDSGRRGGINAWIVLAVLSVLLLSAVLTAAYGIRNDWFPSQAPSPTPKQTPTITAAPVETVSPDQWGDIFRDLIYVSFPDAEQEEAARLMLGVPEGEIRMEELKNVTELYFCGLMTLDTDEAIQYRDGRYMVRTSAPARGEIKNLSLITKLLNLEKLVMIDQEISDISALSGLTRLKELSVAGCPINSLQDIDGFPALEILHLEHTGVRDLRSLNRLPGLKIVTVSPEMIPLNLDPDANYQVILVH